MLYSAVYIIEACSVLFCCYSNTVKVSWEINMFIFICSGRVQRMPIHSPAVRLHVHSICHEKFTGLLYEQNRPAWVCLVTSVYTTE